MKTFHLFLLFFVVLFFASCSKLGPDYKKQNPPKVPKTWENNNSKIAIQLWWKRFNDPLLDTLVEKTLQENLDLRSAGLRILQARAGLGISQNLTFPQVQTLSSSVAVVQKNGNQFMNFSTSFDLGWELDVWGKYARGIESSQATLYASMASYEQVMVSILAELARNYINYCTTQERIYFAKRNITIQKRITEITQMQYNAGNVSELDIQQAKTQLYSTQAKIPYYQLSMQQAKNAMATLLGVLPSELEPLLHTKKTDIPVLTSRDYDFTSFIYIPSITLDKNISISAQTIASRPDIRATEYQVHAQSALIGVAEAELYPQFSLFGSIGYNTQNALGEWTSVGDAIGISAGPAFKWNIFNYTSLKDKVRVQDAKFQESLINYNKKVLLAVQEVQNSLNGYHYTKEQLRLNTKATEATFRAYEISMTQYENGLISYERLLSSVERLTRNEDAQAVLKGNISLQAIALYKALGGGWKEAHKTPYLHEEDVQQMQERSDWDDYFEHKAVLPKQTEESQDE